MFRSRDDRRRRALAEETSQHESVQDTAARGESPLYSQHADDLAKMRLRDLVPLRIRTVALMVTGSVLFIACTLSANHWKTEIHNWLGVESLPAIDLTQPTSLGRWFNGVGLSICTLLSLFIFGLRRYRLDDYRGHYRLWFITSLLMGILSVSAVAPLHELWQVVAVRMSGWSNPKLAHIMWSGPIVLAQLAISIRLFMELQRCRFAMSCLVASQTMLLSMLLIYTDFIKLPSHAVLVTHGLHMLGIVVMGLGLITYARHVLLEIDGVIKSERSVPRVRKEKGKSFWQRRKDRKLRIDSAHEKNEESGSEEKTSIVHKSTRAQAHVHAGQSYSSYGASTHNKDDMDSDEENASNDDEDSSSNNSNRKLSRAERKAMRKQQKSDRRRDEEWE